MKIALGCIYYNNYKELRRLVESIPKGAIDYFIGIDGVFKYTKEQNPNLPDISNDASSLVIHHHSKEEGKYTYVLEELPNRTEFEKRNKYLEICEKLDIDVLIITDTDEVFVYPPGVSPEQAWDTFKKNLEFEMRRYPGHSVFGIRFLEGDADTYKPRVWVNPGKMRYLNNSHYHYGNIETDKETIEQFNKQNLTYIQPAMAIVKGITLKHDPSMRSKEYLDRRKQYQQYLVKFEELVQSHKYTEEEAHKLAKENPDKEFEPTL